MRTALTWDSVLIKQHRGKQVGEHAIHLASLHQCVPFLATLYRHELDFHASLVKKPFCSATWKGRTSRTGSKAMRRALNFAALRLGRRQW